MKVIAMLKDTGHVKTLHVNEMGETCETNGRNIACETNERDM